MSSLFGQSLMVDLFQVDPRLADDVTFVHDFLTNLTKFINMTPQSPPFVFRSPADVYPEKAGLSGWIPLIESGIQVHTLTKQAFVTIDIYTCGDLDVTKAVEYCKEAFMASKVDAQVVDRGEGWNSHTS